MDFGRISSQKDRTITSRQLFQRMSECMYIFQCMTTIYTSQQQFYLHQLP